MKKLLKGRMMSVRRFCRFAIGMAVLSSGRAAGFEVPARGVPSGCDGAAMSEKYWQVWNADEQAKIDADIERNRKADAAIAVDAPDGTEIAVEQLDHEFRFGAHVFNFNQLGRTEWNDAYKKSYGREGVFNQATVAFYWKDYEPEAGKLRAHGEYVDTEEYWNRLSQDAAEEHPYWRRPAPGPVIDYLKTHDVAIHGHILVWGSARPFWLYDRFCPEVEKRRLDVLGVPRRSSPECVKTGEWIGGYETHWRNEWQKAYRAKGEKEIAALAPRYTANLKRLFTKRVNDVAAEFGDAADSWDVVNESAGDWERYHDSATGLPLWKSCYGIMPGDYPLQALKDAKAAFPSEAKLCINDYRISPVFLDQIRDLDRHDVKIDVVGCQMHIFDTNDCMRLANGATDVNCVLRQVQVSRRFFAYARDARGNLLKDAPPAVSTPEFDEKLDAALVAAKHGAVIVSPCISHGEREIAREVFAAGGRVVTLANKGFSPLYKPGGKLFETCADGRLLMLAPIAWPYQPAEKPMTRDDAQTLNRIAQLIVGEEALEIDYKGAVMRGVDAAVAHATTDPSERKSP